MPNTNLPPSPSLTHLKSQAKQLLQAAQAGDDDALARFVESLPRLAQHAPSAIDPGAIALADALSVIAREHGYDSWPKLKRYIEAQTAIETLAAGNLAELGDMLTDNPDLQLQKEIMPRLVVLPDSARNSLQIQIRSIGEALANMSVLGAALGEEVMHSYKRQSHLNKQLHNLQQIIGELADLSDLEARQRAVQAEWFAVETLIAACCVQAGQRAEAKNLEFSYTIPAVIGSIYTDQRLLGKILNYLLVNAIKFTNEGAVKVRVEKVADQLVIAISDTGLGIRPEALETIFNYRDQDLVWTGTGLGLINNIRFAELLGGAVIAESEVGKGSVFTISIPAEYKKDATRPLAV